MRCAFTAGCRPPADAIYAASAALSRCVHTMHTEPRPALESLGKALGLASLPCAGRGHAGYISILNIAYMII